MKNLFGLLSVVVAFFLMMSCNKAADPQLLTDISSFETDWSTLVNDVTNLSNSAKSELANMDAKIGEAKTGTETLKGASKTKVDSLLASLDGAKAKGAAIESGANGLLTKINEITTAFQGWKEKVQKVEIKADAAKTDLANYKQQLEGLKGEATNLKSSWDQIGAVVGAAMSQIAALKAPAPATPAPAKNTTPAKPASKPTTTKPTTTTTTTTTTTNTAPTQKEIEKKMQNVRGNATKTDTKK